jgi:hypothetical protein
MSFLAASPRRRLLVALGAASAFVSAAGCSQYEGLGTVPNMDLIYVTAAATDVLTEQSIPIQQAPRCTANSATLYTCKGTTSDGRAILVRVSEANSKDPQMTITVGNEQIFTGSASTVLNQAAQATP